MQRIRWLLTRLHMRVRTRICRSDSLEEHIDFCSDKCHKCSENVRCPTVISSTVALFPVLSLRVRPPTIKVVLPLRKKYQAVLACTTSVFVFQNGGAWERGYTETPETWIPPYYGHTAVHGPSGGPNGVHFRVVSLCTCATHC